MMSPAVGRGGTAVIAEGQHAPGGIAVDAHNVYWVNASGGPNGTVACTALFP
jgi:hypothetical protein